MVLSRDKELSMRKIGIGIIGCGNISDQYIKNLVSIFEHTTVVAVTDLFFEKAQEKAAKYGIPCACKSVNELLSLNAVDIVVVLTIPLSHAEIAERALHAGKHVFLEKPFATTREEAKRLLRLAERNHLRICSAPDTCLGALIQTGRKVLESGIIGDIIGATMSSSFGSPETWHPNPAFLYKKGAGPLWDNGIYAIHALTYLLGPIKQVSCAARMTYTHRTITSQPHYGEKIEVEVPTFLQSIYTFQSGAISTVMYSCDTCNERIQENGLEIYGSQGTLILSHASRYGGKVSIKTRSMDTWEELPLQGCYAETYRGLGVAELAYAILAQAEQRLSPELIYHILDVLISTDEAWQQNTIIPVNSTFKLTPALPDGLTVGRIAPE